MLILGKISYLRLMYVGILVLPGSHFCHWLAAIIGFISVVSMPLLRPDRGCIDQKIDLYLLKLQNPHTRSGRAWRRSDFSHPSLVLT